MSCQDYKCAQEMDSNRSLALRVGDSARNVDSVSTSTLKPLTKASSNMHPVAATGTTTSSSNGKSRFFKAKESSLPGASDFVGPWQETNSCFHQRSKNTDPESLVQSKKPFYLRTWFGCLLYALLLSLLIAAILALAVNRAVITPNYRLVGEVLSAIQHDSSNTRVFPSTDRDTTTSLPVVPTPLTDGKAAASNIAELTLLELTSAGTLLPDLTTASSLTTQMPDMAALLLAEVA